MRVPREVNTGKLDNPARLKSNRQTGTEPNVEDGNVFGEASGKVFMSATTQVKVSSPEINIVAQGQGLHFPEASIGIRAQGERMTDVPGSMAVAGKRTVCIGTWEIQNVPNGSGRGVEKATRPYDVLEVGPTHSRGVVGVMPGGARGKGSLEGVGGLTKRGDL